MNAWLCYLRAVRFWASLDSQFLYVMKGFEQDDLLKLSSALDSQPSPEKVQCVQISAVPGVEELFLLRQGLR